MVVSDSPRSWMTQRFLEWIRSAGCPTPGSSAWAACRRTPTGLEGEPSSREELDQTVKRLGPRWFVVRNAHASSPPVLLHPREMISLMRGPMTRGPMPRGPMPRGPMPRGEIRRAVELRGSPFVNI